MHYLLLFLLPLAGALPPERCNPVAQIVHLAQMRPDFVSVTAIVARPLSERIEINTPACSEKSFTVSQATYRMAQDMNASATPAVVLTRQVSATSHCLVGVRTLEDVTRQTWKHEEDSECRSAGLSRLRSLDGSTRMYMPSEQAKALISRAPAKTESKVKKK